MCELVFCFDAKITGKLSEKVVLSVGILRNGLPMGVLTVVKANRFFFSAYLVHVIDRSQNVHVGVCERVVGSVIASVTIYDNHHLSR